MIDNDIIKIRDSLFSDLSLWKADSPGKDTFMIGNGRVSAVLGWGEQLNDMGWILGPYYENRFGWENAVDSSYFGTQTARLYKENKIIEMKNGYIGRARQTGIMAARIYEKDGLQWDSINYCSTDKNIITRLFIFQNKGESTLSPIKLQFGWRKPDELDASWIPPWAPVFSILKEESTGMKLLKISVRDSRRNSVRTLTTGFSVPVEIENEIIYIDIPSLQPGELFHLVECMVISNTEQYNASIHKSIFDNFPEDLQNTITSWKTWSASGAIICSSEQWFDDLVDSVKVWCKVQQSFHGVFAPMIFYTDAYIRDCNGPLRLFLRLGMLEEVQDAMNFFRNAAVYYAKNNVESVFSGLNNVRLDVDGFPGDADMDWNMVDPGKSEIPSFYILWHWWYFLQTNDLKYIDRNWQLLLRCLESQHINERNHICFHGDETYRFIIRKKYTGVVHPFYEDMFFDSEYGSFEATILYLYALNAMNCLAGELGKTDDLKIYNETGKKMKESLDKNFWDEKDGCYRVACGGQSASLENPHTIVMSTPAWLNAFSFTDSTVLEGDKVRASWKKSLDFLDAAGWNNAAPYINVTNGHVPGLMLCGAAQFEKSRIKHIIDKTKAIATSAGAYAELYTSYDPESAGGYHGKAWGRLRPWESGINVESMLYALTGFRFDYDTHALCVDPYLPDGWAFFRINSWDCMGTFIGLEIIKEDTGIKYRISNNGSKKIKLNLDGFTGDVIELLPGAVHSNYVSHKDDLHY